VLTTRSSALNAYRPDWPGLEDSLREVAEGTLRPGRDVDLLQRVRRVGLVDEDELTAAEGHVVDLVGGVDQPLPGAVGQPMPNDGVLAAVGLRDADQHAVGDCHRHSEAAVTAPSGPNTRTVASSP
jgi:hypothetical protein